MRLREVLRDCKDRGLDITASWLYMAGEKHGFIVNGTGSRSQPNERFLDRRKFEEWLDAVTAEVPEGYLPVSKAAKELDISVSLMYRFISNGEVPTKQVGAGKGMTYVDIAGAKEFIAKRGIGHKNRKAVNAG